MCDSSSAMVDVGVPRAALAVIVKPPPNLAKPVHLLVNQAPLKSTTANIGPHPLTSAAVVKPSNNPTPPAKKASASAAVATTTVSKKVEVRSRQIARDDDRSDYSNVAPPSLDADIDMLDNSSVGISTVTNSLHHASFNQANGARWLLHGTPTVFSGFHVRLPEFSGAYTVQLVVAMAASTAMKNPFVKWTKKGTKEAIIRDIFRSTWQSKSKEISDKVAGLSPGTVLSFPSMHQKLAIMDHFGYVIPRSTKGLSFISDGTSCPPEPLSGIQVGEILMHHAQLSVTAKAKDQVVTCYGILDVHPNYLLVAVENGRFWIFNPFPCGGVKDNSHYGLPLVTANDPACGACLIGFHSYLQFGVYVQSVIDAAKVNNISTLLHILQAD